MNKRKNKEDQKYSYELNLNWISYAESVSFQESYPAYEQTALVMLRLTTEPIYEDELLKKLHESDIKELESKYVNWRSTGIPIKKEGKWLKPYYDTWATYLIKPEDPLYDLFFAYKLRHLDLLEIDPFLDFQLENWYGNDFKEISRFLRLVIRKHAKKLLSEATTLTVEEWLKEGEKLKTDDTSSKQLKVSLKGIPKREKGDNLTKLSQKETSVLIEVLRQGKIILPESYLSSI